MKEYLKGFMNLEIGQEGMKLSFSHFGLILLLFVLLASGFSAYRIVSGEISQRNIEIEKHRQENEGLKKKIEEQELIIENQKLEIEELSEYKDLIDAVKTLSMNVLTEEQQFELAKVIYDESKKYKFDWKMILAIIMTESSFRYDVKSSDPSYGLMQIKYDTAKSVGEKVGIELSHESDLFDITTNVKIGGHYLWEQVIRFKDVKKAIVAYNLGPSKTTIISENKGGGEINTDYLERVLKRYYYLEKNFNYKQNKVDFLQKL